MLSLSLQKMPIDDISFVRKSVWRTTRITWHTSYYVLRAILRAVLRAVLRTTVSSNLFHLFLPPPSRACSAGPHCCPRVTWRDENKAQAPLNIHTRSGPHPRPTTYWSPISSFLQHNTNPQPPNQSKFLNYPLKKGSGGPFSQSLPTHDIRAVCSVWSLSRPMTS